jgi:hypothetical protein
VRDDDGVLASGGQARTGVDAVLVLRDAEVRRD